MKKIVVMPGGFHPFHTGHAALYKSAVKAFPDADVYVAATNDTKTRPFPFSIKEKLAKLAGVAPGHFIQVKSPFKAEEITSHYNPNEDVLIFVRSEKDKNEQPKPGGTKKDGTPAYFQPWPPKNLQPFNKHAYIAYLPTVEFGPGITSATEIRNAWPNLNDKRKTAMVMSLYPVTQKNPKLAANVVKMLDMGMGNELDEGWKEKVGAAALAGGVALGGLSTIGKSADTNWDKFPQQMRTQQDNKGNEKIMSVAGPDSKGEYRVRITDDNDVHEFITKTPPKGLKEEFRPSTNQAMNIHRQTTQKINPNTNKFIWKRPNQIGGSYTENELKSLNFKYSMKYNMWGGTQQMWDRLIGKVNEFAPPSSGRDDGGNDRNRRLRKLLEIAIRVAEEQNVGTLDKIPAMNTIAGDDFFSVAVEGILPDITDKEYMFVLESAYKTVKQGLAEGKRKRKKKSKNRSLGRYFFPGYGYYGGSGESGEGGGDGGGESVAEGSIGDKIKGAAKSVKRAAQGWGVGGAPDMVTPKGVVQAFDNMDGQRLANFVASRKELSKPGKDSARAFADKVIDREMKQRGYGRVADKDEQGVAEGDVVPFKQPSKTLTWDQVPRDILLLANDWFWASEDNSGLDATIDPKGFGSGTANDVKYNAAKLQQKGWTIDYNDEYDGPGEFNLRLTNKRGQTVLLSIEDAQDFTGWAEGTNQGLHEFAPPGSDDREPDEEEILRQLAAQWWNGSIQQMKKAQQTLQAMGWDIGQDESGDEDAGVFVIRIGDENGDSYIAFPHSELGLNEDYLNEQ